METTERDATLILETARREIAGRIAYWKRHPDRLMRACVVANLQWALAQLDDAEGYVEALRRQRSR